MEGYNLLFFLLLTLSALSSSVDALAQEDESAWSLSLDSITVKGSLNRSPVKIDSEGTVVWDMAELNMMPQMLGVADPIHYAQMLPYIQTNNEYKSGLNIEGCDNQHNSFTLNGVPLFNVNHLLGFFSAFNSSHFSTMSISKGITSAESTNRLGGQIDMRPDTNIQDSINGRISLGLISSQGTIRLPIGNKTVLTASLRGSYMNVLYSSWMKADGNQITYSFYDSNITLITCPKTGHNLILDYYNGKDMAKFEEKHYLANLKDHWGNTMGAMHWLYDYNGVFSHSKAYITNYSNKFRLDMQEITFYLPSSITDFGIGNKTKWNHFSLGLDVIWHYINPQSIEHEGDFLLTDKKAESVNSYETTVFGTYKHSLFKHIYITAGLRGSIYIIGKKTFHGVDPSMQIHYEAQPFNLSASYAIRHQYLFQTGFTDSGMPTEYWISSNNDLRPQYIHDFSLNTVSYWQRNKYEVSASLFYKRLYNQIGNRGSVLDFINNLYDNNNLLTHGKGENYGFSIAIRKRTGKLTGWLSYTFTHAKRSFKQNGYATNYPASHERPHELNGVATYSINKHWNFGGTLVWATGTPYTPIKSLFLINNNIAINYGEYNSARLNSYMRLDISANYRWKSKSNREHGINLSFYNVTCRRNDLFYYLHARKVIELRPTSFIFKVLPSVNYHFNF